MPRPSALTTESHYKETFMNLKTMIPTKAMCLVPLTALWLASAPVQAQTAPAKAPTVTMPMGHESSDDAVARVLPVLLETARAMRNLI
ncbi:MAG: hypothetical protein Q7T38_02805 [Gallionella sp.]|nr:hypothetical protein [Gallionella sp.]